MLLRPRSLLAAVVAVAEASVLAGAWHADEFVVVRRRGGEELRRSNFLPVALLGTTATFRTAMNSNNNDNTDDSINSGFPDRAYTD